MSWCVGLTPAPILSKFCNMIYMSSYSGVWVYPRTKFKVSKVEETVVTCLIYVILCSTYVLSVLMCCYIHLFCVAISVILYDNYMGALGSSPHPPRK